MSDSDNKDPNGDDPADQSGKSEGFGLVRPTGDLAKQPIGDRPEPCNTEQIDNPSRDAAGEEGQFKSMAWKGFEVEEDDPDPNLSFGPEKEKQEDDLDMTPMVDVVFLLLIFFMVTASFTLQKSIEQPPSTIEDPSTNVIEDPEDEDQYVEVIIDQTNTYYVTTKDEEEVEAPSDREMRARMRDAQLSSGAVRLIIRAHVDSMHRKAVTVWDAGNNAGFDEIQMRTTDEDY